MGRRHVLTRGDARLSGIDVGHGRCVLFQHGLGGALDQVAEAVGTIGDVRWLALECRGHGRSTAGRERPFSLAMLAADIRAYLDARGAENLVVGGVSMGAALALRIAVDDPARAQGLILLRPAWTFEGPPPSLAPQRAVAAWLGAAATAALARAAFLSSRLGEQLRRDDPARVSRLLAWFERENPRLQADLLDGLASDGAGVTRAAVAALDVPALVIGDPGDTTHPLAAAEALAAVLPRARLVVVPPRTAAKEAHRQAVTRAIAAFLGTLGPTG